MDEPCTKFLWCTVVCQEIVWTSYLKALKTLRPRQNGRHFVGDISKCIFLNENIWIWINISLKFVPKGHIHNIPSLVQILTWCQTGKKQTIIWTNDGLGYWRIYASLRLREVNAKKRSRYPIITLNLWRWMSKLSGNKSCTCNHYTRGLFSIQEFPFCANIECCHDENISLSVKWEWAPWELSEISSGDSSRKCHFVKHWHFIILWYHIINDW